MCGSTGKTSEIVFAKNDEKCLKDQLERLDEHSVDDVISDTLRIMAQNSKVWRRFES